MTEPLNLADVELRGGPLVLATHEAVDDLEARLGVRMPGGYREYVTTLGEGMLNALVRVLPPWRILSDLEEHRGLMAGFWFWESGEVHFGQEEALESIPIADTLDGDMIVFHPAEAHGLIVLPRDHERLYARGPDLLETINWVCSGGVLRSFGPHRDFEPFDSRLEAIEPPPAPTASLPEEQPPDLTRSPREVLLAYFRELRTVEEWAVEKAGGPEALRSDDIPDIDDERFFADLIARSNRVHARYCSPFLAKAMSGASVTISSPLEHDPAVTRVVGEREERPGRVVIAVEGQYGLVDEYHLDQSGHEWRITSRMAMP